MKVLIINPILYTSETDAIRRAESIKDTMIYALCMGFVKNGDEPVLIAAENYRPLSRESYPFSVLWFPCVLPKLFKPRCIPMLKGLSKYLVQHKGEYDYIISSEVFALHTLSAALYAKRKLLIWHELGAHNHMLKKIPSKLWYNVIAGLFMRNIPIVPRSAVAAEFISSYCKNVKAIKIDHGVDLTKVRYSEEKNDYFLVLSQLIERKQIDKIIEAFAAFRKGKYEHYKLKIIGEGILKEQLQQQARELQEQDHIQFLGQKNHEELMPVLAGAKALLVYTRKDNSMVSIVESIAAGTPILTTSVPFNAIYIQEAFLGIVKDDWGASELEEICNRNTFYVKNCILYREKLGNQYLAGQFNKIGEML